MIATASGWLSRSPRACRLAGDIGGDVDEQAFLLVWCEPHSRTIRTDGFHNVARRCRTGFHVLHVQNMEKRRREATLCLPGRAGTAAATMTN